ncbi:MAG: hypothetical protein ACRDWE_06180 [Acidimicrobiales bacterium]
MDRNVLTVELMRMVARLGPRNGHTAIHPLREHPMERYSFPLCLYEFDDGVFVIAAERQDLVGAELAAVDGTDIDEVLSAVAPLIGHDNEWTIRARRPDFVVDAAVLRGLDLVGGDRRATFGLRRPNGKVVDLALDAIATGDYLARFDGDFAAERSAPAHLRRIRESHWAGLAADGLAVQVGYNVTLGSTEDLADQVEALAKRSQVGLVVADLRHNRGGDNTTYGPLLHALQRLSDEKRLAVLTSRATFSAAMQLVVDLEQSTPAIFVGEPTGASPNHYGDATAIELPNSGLNAYVATIAWMTGGESDERLTREPDISVTNDSRAFFAGRDPVLDAAVAAIS